MASFTGIRYITDGVRYEIGEQLQVYLWSLIEKLKDQMEDLDYLQVFELEILPTGVQTVTHKTEDPSYQMVHYIVDLPLQFAFKKKVYVVDSDSYVVMMLAEEY